MIFIVDDDIAVRTSLILLLENEGYHTSCADKPEKAIKILFEEKPQLIILDLNFSLQTSGDEGIELLKQIRQINSSIPIVLITGWGSIELAVLGMKLGASDFINKPWSNDHLLQSIKTLLTISTHTFCGK